METAIFTVKNEDNLYGSSLKVEAPINSTREDVLELYFEKYEPDSDADYQDMITANYGILSDELEISYLQLFQKGEEKCFTQKK